MTTWRVGLFVLLIQFVGMARAADTESPIPTEISAELGYLLSFVGPSHAPFRDFDTGKVLRIFRFVAAAKSGGGLLYPAAEDGVASAYYETDIQRGLGDVLQLTDNPDVPAEFTAPSTVRWSEWVRVDTPDGRRPKLWESLPGLSSTLAFAGIEHLVNTPDENTGTYYEYDLHRSIILTRIDGRKLLISLSRQTGVSDAGKKGLIVGHDGGWDYLYSSQQGLNRFGLGWVDAYIYHSFSAAFYLEGAGQPSPTRLGVFKWLRAGWSDINFVQRAHIYQGLRRYGGDLKQIAEHPSIGESSGWSAGLDQIRQLGDRQLRQQAGAHLAALQKQASPADAGEVQQLLQAGGYLDRLTRRELQSIATLELLKQLLNKPDTGSFRRWPKPHESPE